MPAQQHKILRQVLELRGCPPDAARQVQSELRAACYRRLVPLIDKVCSQLSTPGRMHRIDKLEVDLGEVPLAALDTVYGDEFETAFSERLAAAIGDAAQADSELELLDYFIRTGALPWWADASDGNPLHTAVESLVRRAPQALRATIRAATDPERARRRLVRACPDPLLEKLAGALAPILAAACPGMGSACIAMLESARRKRGAPASAARHLVWEELLRAADAGDAPAAGAPRFFGAVLARVARRLGHDYRSLVADLYRATETRAVPAPRWVREVVQTLRRELGDDVVESRRSADARLVGLLAQLEADSAPEAVLWSRLRAVLGRLPASLQIQAAAAVDSAKAGRALDSKTVGAIVALVRAAMDRRLVKSAEVERYTGWLRVSPPPGMSATVAAELGAKLGVIVGETTSGKQAPAADAALWERLRAVLGDIPAPYQAPAAAALDDMLGGAAKALNSTAIDALAALVRAALGQHLVEPSEVERAAARLEFSPPPGMSAALAAALGVKLRDAVGERASRTRRAETRTDVTFSETDALYVENAGLVVLWPFLEHFFGRLGLLEEKRFKNEAAAHRAAGLLQYVAGVQEPPPEFLLPLNKVLCGIAPDEVFDFGDDITAEETGECADLLAAVIKRAPILGDMSIPGFRASFLLRKGQLSARDGHWLLRVERETHDVVLDRFPWGVGIVKLPWMAALMQVEW